MEILKTLFVDIMLINLVRIFFLFIIMLYLQDPIRHKQFIVPFIDSSSRDKVVGIGPLLWQPVLLKQAFLGQTGLLERKLLGRTDLPGQTLLGRANLLQLTSL